MSNYDPKRVIQDFAARTITNLEFVENYERTHKSDVYEVTQLINSLLGLIVFPYEKISKSLPQIRLNELINNGWPRLSITLDVDGCNTLGQLIKNMRHGISHSNIIFAANEQNEIVGIVLWNCRSKTNIKIWEVRMSIRDLKEIVCKFHAILQDISEEVAQEMVIAA